MRLTDAMRLVTWWKEEREREKEREEDEEEQEEEKDERKEKEKQEIEQTVSLEAKDTASETNQGHTSFLC